MGKKSKGNKLAKMSEEERARYLQLRADIEEETRRRKIHLIALYMKNKLKREDAFCRLNMAKINQEWRYILRQVKCQELRNEVVELERSCQQLLQHKDQVIKRLWHDLNVANDMHDTLFQSHLETIQNFKDIQQQRMEFFRQNYEQQKLDLLNENQQEYNEWKRLSDRSQEQLENIYYQLEQKTNNEETEAEEKYLEKLDDLHATTQIKIEQITEKGEKKLQDLWSEYQEILDNYVKHTEHYYADYMDLKEQDEDYTKQTAEYSHEIEKLSHQMANLKILLKDEENNGESYVKQLKDLREHLNEKLKNLKLNFDRELRNQNVLFKVMSVASYQAIKKLKRQLEKAKTLLQLATVCRKFETERELLRPSTLPRLTKKIFLANDNDIADDDKNFLKKPENIGNYNIQNWLLMEDFWTRVNNVKIDIISLQQQKKALQQENQRHKSELQERLIHLNISQGRNVHVNDHLIKRPNSMHVERIKRNAVDIMKPPAKCHSAKPGLEKVARQRFPYACITEANFTNVVRSQQLKNKYDKRFLLAKVNQ